MSKGKSHSRGARSDVMRANERNLRRKQKAIQHRARVHDLRYNRQAYDGSTPLLEEKSGAGGQDD
jgi:hypothetical protein